LSIQRLLIEDWQETQNSEYIELLRKRLSEDRLIWVDQFIDLITSNVELKGGAKLTPLRINDFGCNVGHFLRGCRDLLGNFDYMGYDISETYLSIARASFGLHKQLNFECLDFSLSGSRIEIRPADVSVISATLEHVQNYKQALDNVFLTTRKLVLLRTFIGNEQLLDYCLTKGAKSKYLIRQFTDQDLIGGATSLGWNVESAMDKATKGIQKYVCNGDTIPRTQSILIFRKKENDSGI
jgi:hypothetical protein